MYQAGEAESNRRHDRSRNCREDERTIQECLEGMDGVEVVEESYSELQKSQCDVRKYDVQLSLPQNKLEIEDFIDAAAE